MDNIHKHYFDYEARESYYYMKILDNKIDIFDVPAMSKQIHDAFDKLDYPNLVIDIQTVVDTDSAGIGLLISLMTRCKKNSNQAVLLCNEYQLNTSLKVAKVDSFFPVFTTLEQAENYFQL